MRSLLSLVCFSILTTSASAGNAPYKEARTNALKGNFGEAIEQFQEVAKNPKHRVRSLVEISKLHVAKGDYDKADKVIAEALKETANEAELLARAAALQFERGRWDEAEKLARKAVEVKEQTFLAQWILGSILRDRGQTAEADKVFRWFIRTYSKRQNDDDEISDSDELRLVGLAGLERARHYHLTDQFQFVLTEIFGYSLKQDPLYWPAEVEKGKLYLEKHNKALATKAFDRALTINPRAADALVGKGQLAALAFEFKDAEGYAEQALKINPNLISALQLRAEVLLFGSDFENALKDLDKAYAINPRHEATLALLASVYHAQRKTKEFEAKIAEVEKFTSSPYVFFTQLAQAMEGRKLYYEAEKYYLKATDLQPKLSEARAGLGDIYMRLGDEAKGRKYLEEAFKGDNFHIRVFNQLAVLDHLDKYKELRTKNFLIKYDAKHDELLAKLCAKQLEACYEEFAKKFAYRPPGPILIEIFNKHEMFSGRVVSLPDLHTIGACTGKMFAMVSTHDKSKVIAKPFNWVRVIRHELVHIFNLEQTKFQCPHWLTEGLAVMSEGSVQPPSWKPLLAEKYYGKDLLNLDNILLAFARPRSPAQWQQAYLQSLLYTEYLIKAHGEPAVGKMLAAFAEDMDTADALKKAVGITKEEFEKGYLEFVTKRVEEGGIKASKKAITLKELKEANAKDPDDQDIAAQLAERYYLTGKRKDARELAEKVLAKNRDHGGAAYVKAMLLIDAGDQDVGMAILNSFNNDQTKEIKPLRALAKIQFEQKEIEKAADTLERCRRLEPHDPTYISLLAKVYLKLDRKDKLREILEDVTKFDPDDPLPRKKLAQIYQEANDHAKAEKFARMVLEIDVKDGDAQKILVEALRAQEKMEEAREWQALFDL